MASDDETTAKLVEMIKAVAGELEKISAKTGAFFPDGVPYFTEWPEALQEHIGSDDGLEYLYNGLQAFASGDAQSAVLHWASEIEKGTFPPPRKAPARKGSAGKKKAT